MLPRVLLFASDERTARWLMPLLSELQFEVEHCPEIFAAIERLTSRSYQAIIADWTQELEAGFFLKTARELKPTKSVFTLAVVDEKNVTAAFQVGVNGVLQKPVAIEQARNTLLSARQLITGTNLESSVHVPDISEVSRVTQQDVPGSIQELLQAERLEATVSRHRRPEPVPLTFAGAALPISGRSTPSRAAMILAAAVFVFAGVGVAGWKFLDSTRHSAQGQFTAITVTASAAPQPVLLANATLANTESPLPESKIEHKASLPSPRQGRLGSVLPVSPSQKAKPQESNSSLLVPDDSAPEASPLDVAGVNRPVPDSLLTPVPAMTAREAPTKLSSGGTKWTGEPIALPEEISHALLLHQVIPSYPEQALRAGIHGAVVLHAWVARDGSIRDLKLVQGSLLLGRAAFEAVKQWRYRPYRVNGEIVEMQTSVTIDFKQP